MKRTLFGLYFIIFSTATGLILSALSLSGVSTTTHVLNSKAQSGLSTLFGEAWFELPAEAQGFFHENLDSAVQHLLENVSRPDTLPGVVVASPSRQAPPYYYHWVRDGALVMDVIETLGKTAARYEDAQHYRKLLVDYVEFSRQNQLTRTQADLGEPKFNVDGSAFNDRWGRPQNDGPALRAVTLIHFARTLLREGNLGYVRAKLYDSQSPTNTVIKADLEYVSHHWQDPSYDLWEEIKADHFFTRIVQRRALVEGAQLASDLGDQGAASWYRSQASALEATIPQFFRQDRGWIVPSTNWVDGIRKFEDMDSAVILGVLRGYAGDYYTSPIHDWALATYARLATRFAGLYPINQRSDAPGIAIGRYPEDRYAGAQFDGGNPWVLSTYAFAEFAADVENMFQAAGRIRISAVNLPFFRFVLNDPAGQLGLAPGQIITAGTPMFTQILSAIRDQSDRFMAVVDYHANADGSLSEQIQRNSGFMTSAENLTWNYASFITATWARQAAGISH